LLPKEGFSPRQWDLDRQDLQDRLAARMREGSLEDLDTPAVVPVAARTLVLDRTLVLNRTPLAAIETQGLRPIYLDQADTDN